MGVADKSLSGNVALLGHCKLCKQALCVSVSPSTLARPVARSVTPAGSCTASSMASSLMVTCLQIKPSETILSQHSSLKQEPENMFLGPSLSILSLLSLMRLELEPTGNFFIPSS